MSLFLLAGIHPPLVIEGVPDALEDEHLDIDRWENDGGRSPEKT